MKTVPHLVPCLCCGQPTAADPQGILDAIAMSRLQRRLANRMAQSFGRFLDRNDLIEALYGDRRDGGPDSAPKIVDIEIHWLRQLLLLSPLAVETASSNASCGGRRLVWRQVAAA